MSPWRGGGDRFGRGVANRQHAAGEFAVPRRETDRECRSLDRLVQRRDDAGGVEHRAGAGRQCGGLGVRKLARRHDDEPGDPHREHGPRRGADVARVARRDEDDADARKKVGGRHAVTIPLSLFAGGPLPSWRRPAAQPDLMHPTLSIAVKAARRAGNVINRGARDLDLLTVTSKGPKDFVSEVDREAERQIVETLLAAYPDHAILAEEGTAKGANADAENVWIIDPLDGTTNFLHGFPQYCVSIALAHRGQVTQGVIYDPCRNDLFTATRGRGAFLNDRRIRVSRRTHLRDCLIGTGFPFRDGSYLDIYLKMMKTMIESTAGLRRPGAAALDLAYVGAGFYDGFWEVGLNPWDVAAGSLLIQEAGGLIGDLAGEGEFLHGGQVIAASPKIFAQMVTALAPFRLEIERQRAPKVVDPAP